ncbi:unnamed protein product [Amoebophrya sp. A120]|nr:unnamed protein product [Amoebophrya sp. A120]|eukprot:GSA120T00007781001.1
MLPTFHDGVSTKSGTSSNRHVENEKTIHDTDIEEVLDGNLCRCTGYRSILQSFKTAFKDEYGKNDKCTGKKFGEFVDKVVFPQLKKLQTTTAVSTTAPGASPAAALKTVIKHEGVQGAVVYPGTYHQPTTVQEAIQIAKSSGNFRYQAGATERKIEQLKISGRFKYPLDLISLNNIEEICSEKHMELVDVDQDLVPSKNKKFEDLVPEVQFTIPANLPLADIENRFRKFLDFSKHAKDQQSSYIAQVIRAYLEMFKWFAGHQIRNVATFSGNLITASPIADLAPVHMAVGCKVEVATDEGDGGAAPSQAASGAGGTTAAAKKTKPRKSFPIDNSFFTGYRKTVLSDSPTDILHSFHIPLGTRDGSDERNVLKKDHVGEHQGREVSVTYKKFIRAYKASRRKEDDLSIVNGCFFVEMAVENTTISSQKEELYEEETTIPTVQSCRFAFGGLAPFTRRCTPLEKFWEGKKWTSENFQTSIPLITDFFQLPPDVPGGMPMFRKLLARSLFFKFFKEVEEEIFGPESPVRLLKTTTAATVQRPKRAKTQEKSSSSVDQHNKLKLALSQHSPKSLLSMQDAPMAHQHFPIDKIGDMNKTANTRHLAAHLHVSGKAAYSYDQVLPATACNAGGAGSGDTDYAGRSGKNRHYPKTNPTDTMFVDFVLSNKPHAKIKSFDFSEAEKVTGYIGNLTLEDLNFCKTVGPIMHDDEIFPADNVVNHLGQVVCCVVADSREAARECAMVTSIVWDEETKFDFTISIEEAIAKKSFHHVLFVPEEKKHKPHQVWTQREPIGTKSFEEVERFFKRGGDVLQTRKQGEGEALPPPVVDDNDTPTGSKDPRLSDGEEEEPEAKQKPPQATKFHSRLKATSNFFHTGKLQPRVAPQSGKDTPLAFTRRLQTSLPPPATFIPPLRLLSEQMDKEKAAKKAVDDAIAKQKEKPQVDVLEPKAHNSDFEEIQSEIYMGGQEHFYFETHSTAVEMLSNNEEVIVYSSTQNVAESQAFISEVCGIPNHKVHVKVTRLGGGFGGKETRSCLLGVYPVLACQKYGRNQPGGVGANKCKFLLERDTDFKWSGQRHSFVAQYRMLLNKKEKKIQAIDCKLFANAGCSYDLSNPVLNRAMLHVENCLNIENLRVQGFLCKTNIPSNTAFRGFGGPQGLFVAETMYQKAADYLGVSREDLYEKQMYRSLVALRSPKGSQRKELALCSGGSGASPEKAAATSPTKGGTGRAHQNDRKSEFTQAAAASKGSLEDTPALATGSNHSSPSSKRIVLPPQQQVVQTPLFNLQPAGPHQLGLQQTSGDLLKQKPKLKLLSSTGLLQLKTAAIQLPKPIDLKRKQEKNKNLHTTTQGNGFWRPTVNENAAEEDKEDLTFYNHPIGTHVPIREMVKQITEKSQFKSRQKEIEDFNKKNKFVKRGIALIPTKYGISFTAKHLNQSAAQVNLYKDGTILLHHGGHEMGQGVHTKVASIAALMFGVPIKLVHVMETDTSNIPNTSPTAASTGSDLNGFACQMACAELLERLEKILKKHGLKVVADNEEMLMNVNKSYSRRRTSTAGEEIVDRIPTKSTVKGGKEVDEGVDEESSADDGADVISTGGGQGHNPSKIPFRRIDWTLFEQSLSPKATAATETNRDELLLLEKQKLLSKIATEAWFNRINLCGRGFYATPISGVDWGKSGKNEFTGEPFYYYSWGVGVSEVEVDTLTGDFQTLRTDLIHDVGRSLTPLIDIGQIEGAFTQGLGLFTSEEVIYLQNKDRNSASHFSVGPGFYKIPAVGNCPRRFETHLLENSRGPSVLGSKAIGEPPLFLACSVFFAIREACLALVSDKKIRNKIAKDIRFDSPLTAERIRVKCAQILFLAGEQGKKNSAAVEKEVGEERAEVAVAAGERERNEDFPVVDPELAALHQDLFEDFSEPCVATAFEKVQHWHARV